MRLQMSDTVIGIVIYFLFSTLLELITGKSFIKLIIYFFKNIFS
ncbi:hypothetical protein BX659_1453 [Orenia metallireducens]|uniref:Uncharacterized protein n=1 Tax=Orenia metallireducens TaxID=1413210 RepID=A0A285IFU6_9FIRM|nr:hypothetical protein BX659_1453 [Orenia metallireducens]SNY46870.1 hypothetical protein SAMN06265827_1463 [Orenia metallireducens]